MVNLKMTGKMKKIITLIAAMAAFVACSKVDVTAPDAGIAQNREIKFNINVGGFDGPETKAVKTGWESGDKINIWFNSNDYKTPDLVMTYDGSAWSYGELADTFEPETGQKFVAIYEGFNDLSKYDYRDGFYASPFTYVGYNFPMIVASKGTYEYSDDTITADLSTGWSFGTRLQVYVSGLDKNTEYVLSCPSLRPLKNFGPTASGLFAFGKGTAGDVVTGVPYGDGVAFYFLDNYDKSGMAADYKFTLTQYSAAGSVVSEGSYTANGKTLTIDSKKCQSIKISASKFPSILPGKFSIGNGKQIQFSKGNLVATVDASGAPTAWKFAANQYDYLGKGGANKTIGTAAGDVDLFGWSTATTTYGISTSTSSSDYSGDFVDWGKNIGDGSTWRTLSTDEWQYLFVTRTNASSLYKYGVTVCGKANCLIIAPDGFTGSIASSYDASTWPAAEASGLVCLPAAGYRSGSSVYYVDAYGYYWSSSANGSDYAYFVTFFSSSVSPDYNAYRFYGHSVRLVTDVEGSAPEEPVIDPLAGKFSVGASKQVQFSRGNLQATYDGSKYTWGFAEHQYDYVGNKAGNTTIDSQTSGAVVDLFGWSTAATNFGINTSTSSSDYSGGFVDWGKNIGDGSTWRTLSKDEWTYLFNKHSYKWVTVNGVSGYVIASDGFTGTLADSYADDAALAADNLVFLPAAGYRNGSSVYYVDAYGYYWSSSANGSNYAYFVTFFSSSVSPDYNAYRFYGYSVRLVTDVK